MKRKDPSLSSLRGAINDVDGKLLELLAERRSHSEEIARIKKPGSAQLLLGIAYYNNKEVFRAKSSFIEASNHEKYRANAEQWIAHIEKESQAS